MNLLSLLNYATVLEQIYKDSSTRYATRWSHTQFQILSESRRIAINASLRITEGLHQLIHSQNSFFQILINSLHRTYEINIQIISVSFKNVGQNNSKITFPRWTNCLRSKLADSVLPAPLSPLMTIAWLLCWQIRA